MSACERSGCARTMRVERRRDGDLQPLSTDRVWTRRGSAGHWIGCTGVFVHDGRLVVADAWNHRILIWDDVPMSSDRRPDVVLGQADASSVEENRGELGPDSFRWPHGIAGAQSGVLVADAGNHRLLGWQPAPATDGPATMVLGQTDFVTGSEFPYIPQTRSSMRFLSAVDIHGDTMVVADTANNRVTVWDLDP